MKKIKEKIKSAKLNENKFISLNGKMLKKIKGGTIANGNNNGNTDHVCGKCGSSSAYL